MKGNQKRPLWSQPLCDHCYFVRFSVPCEGRSPWRKKEHCFDCGAITEDGIYNDVRPPEEVEQSRRAYGAQDGNEFERIVEAWVRQHGEYRRGEVPGSAEGDELPPPDAAEERDK
jgi:hypothetical protein